MVLYERVKDLCGVPFGLRIGVGLVPPYRYSVPFPQGASIFRGASGGGCVLIELYYSGENRLHSLSVT